MADCNTMCRASLAIIGFMLCVYTLHVEISSIHDVNYKALCDINEHISCTKVFNSKYGKGFGLVEPIFGKDSPFNLPNPVFGLVFYSLLFILSLCGSSVFILKLSCLLCLKSCLMSIYLGYILYTMRDTCVVCITTYIVNFAMLFLNVRKCSVSVTEKYKTE